MAILATSAVLLTVRILQDLLRGCWIALIVSLLCAVLRRVAPVQDKIVEVTSTTNTVHLLILIGR